jgi:DNA mismatch repair ATPase MutS
VQVIEGRLDLVETFIRDEDLREDIVGFLKNTHDSQRIVQKFSLGRADADDLVALARTIEATSSILKRLQNANAAAFNHIISRVKAPMDLAHVILDSIDEEGVRRQQSEVAEVAMTLTGSVDSEEVNEAERAMEEVLEEVVESGSKGKRRGAGRRKRISRGIEKAVNRGAMLTEQEGDEAWVMKKTFVRLFFPSLSCCVLITHQCESYSSRRSPPSTSLA